MQAVLHHRPLWREPPRTRGGAMTRMKLPWAPPPLRPPARLIKSWRPHLQRSRLAPMSLLRGTSLWAVRRRAGCGRWMDPVSQPVLRLHLSGGFKLFSRLSWRTARSLITILSRGIDINLARQLDRSSIISGNSSSVAPRVEESLFFQSWDRGFLLVVTNPWNNCCQLPSKASDGALGENRCCCCCY